MTLKNITELNGEFKRRHPDLVVTCPMGGNFHAEIVAVGEAPGENEVLQEKPFVGGSGAVLWTALRRHNINKTMVYATNVMKRRAGPGESTPQGRTSDMNRHERDNWAAAFKWELEELPNVRYVLVLGSVALDACRQWMDMKSVSGITMWRGSVVEGEIAGRPVQFILTYNPAHIIRERKFEITFRFDLAKLRRVIDGKFVHYEIEERFDPSPKEAVEWIDMMHDGKVPVAFDIEVVSGETACVGLAGHNHRGYCINLRTLSTNRFSLFEERTILRRLARFFGDHTVQLVAQNGIFDTAWLWYKDGIRVDHVWFDTLLAHHTLYSSLPHNLGYLTAQYTDHPFYKDEGQTWREGGKIDDYWRYNVKDCCITRKVMEREMIELQRDGLETFFFDHVMRLQPHLVRMITGGVLCDTALKTVIVADMEEYVGELLNKFYHDAQVAVAVHESEKKRKKVDIDDTFFLNPNSWKQLQKLFFRKLELVGRGYSTNAENRKRMRLSKRSSSAARQMLDTLDTYATEHKFLSTYATSELDEDDRFRCEYRQFGTTRAPGRLSSAQTAWMTGMNLQNQPERSKSMFVADEGYVLLYFDLEQAEARYVGWDANIDKWKEDFERARLNPGSYDCHRALASDMWRIPYDEVPVKDFDDEGGRTLRYIAKRCRHGLNYRMQPDRLATVTGLDINQARAAFDIYHAITPELRMWWEKLVGTVRSEHRLFSSYGRRLVILERIDDGSLDSIVAFRPQSSIGDKVNEVIYLAHDDKRWPTGSRIALNVHDALVALSKPDDAMRCLSIMKKYAEVPINVTSIMTKNMEPMIIPAECKMTTQRTLWRMDENKKLEFYNDDKGLFRWSHLSTVDVEAAA